jgi:hypothetical protein
LLVSGNRAEAGRSSAAAGRRSGGGEVAGREGLGGRSKARAVAAVALGWVVEDPGDDGASTWAMISDIWPMEDRPERMTNPRIMNLLTFDQSIKYKKSYESLMKKEGKGDGVFGKDNPLPTKKFVQLRTIVSSCYTLLGGFN